VAIPNAALFTCALSSSDEDELAAEFALTAEKELGFSREGFFVCFEATRVSTASVEVKNRL
jgi:hypothetical protein